MINVDRDITVHDYIPGQPVPVLIRDRKDPKKIIVNPLKRWVKPFTLSIEPAEITIPPNSVSEPIPMPIDNKGHYEIIDAFFKSEQPEGFTVILFDPENRPILMNREVHVATIASGGGVTTNLEAFGTDSSAGRPFRWPETFWMNIEKHGKAIFAVFRNLSNQENKIRFTFHGLRWYYVQAPQAVADRMQEIYKLRLRTMPYFFTTDKFVQLAATGSPGDTGEFSVRFGDEAWTEVIKQMAFSNGFDLSGIDNDFDVLIKETTSQKSFMSGEPPRRTSRNLVFGNGEFPFQYWESSLFEPNMRLTFDLKNNLVQQSNTIWITLGCRKIFWDPKEDTLART